MGKIWLIMLISSIATLLFINPSAAIKAMLDGSEASLKLALNLVAMYGFWLGFFAVLEQIGAAQLIAKLLGPLIRFLFKGASPEAHKYISMNMSANLIGLGNAATPMGINAMKSMDDGSGRANANMIMLVVISSTSLQFLPSTVISLRTSHGSANPTDFLLPCIIATVFSTIIGIVLVKICSKIFPDKKREKKSKTAEALPLAPAKVR